MSDIEKVVREAVDEVSSKHYSQELVNEKMNDLTDAQGDVDINGLLEFLVEFSTGYSNTVLTETLERLQDKGYLKAD
ncbi:hypothetical protein [Salinicoccus sp. CNSTN-B1]